MVQDPVCKEIIRKEDAKLFTMVKTYYFCSKHCKDEFVNNPEKYVSLKPKRPENSGC